LLIFLELCEVDCFEYQTISIRHLVIFLINRHNIFAVSYFYQMYTEAELNKKPLTFKEEYISYKRSSDQQRRMLV